MSPTDDLALQPILHTALARAGELADAASARNAFSDYRSRKATQTVKRQDDALALFASFLAETAGYPVTGEQLAGQAAAWAGVTFGLVDAFCKWMLLHEYSIGTINSRLSTIKTYARLAGRGKGIPADQVSRILNLSGYSKGEAGRVNEKRKAAGRPTRRSGAKKEIARVLSRAQTTQLKEQPDTPQGRRDQLLVNLLVDHGLRAGEVAGLQVVDVDLKSGTLTFQRPKVNKEQTHRLTADTLRAALSYMQQDALPIGPLLRGSKKGGELTTAGMSTRAISDRIHILGERIGVEGLSAHDLRHTWATNAARSGTPVDRLQDAGGWSSPAMPLRYVEKARIANQGVRLEENQ